MKFLEMPGAIVCTGCGMVLYPQCVGQHATEAVVKCTTFECPHADQPHVLPFTVRELDPVKKAP
jgi:hypothetical protein